MKTERIIAFTGIYGCLIVANTTDSKIMPWFWIGLATYWTIRYLYLTLKQE